MRRESLQERWILVAEPDSGLREALVRRLTVEGWQARGAARGAEAVARLEARSWSVVLCDLRLEDDTGVPVAAHVRVRRPEAGLVLLAAAAEGPLAAAGVPEAADDFLLRERTEHDLPVVLRRALAQQRLREENAALRASLEREMRERARGLARSLRKVGRAYRLALESLVAALDAREGETQRHSRRVAEYTLRLTQVLDLPERERRSLFHGALLHDLGKIGIPDSILLKPAPLTAEEWRVMRSHPRVGYAIVRDLPFLRAAAECVVGHHERYDGLGYPLGLRGRDLPRPARIVAVADALDAMSVRRPYRRALPFERIHEELVTHRGTQFDPEVVDAAVHLFRGYADLHPDAQASRRLAERVRVVPEGEERAAA